MSKIGLACPSGSECTEYSKATYIALKELDENVEYCNLNVEVQALLAEISVQSRAQEHMATLRFWFEEQKSVESSVFGLVMLQLPLMK